MKAPLLVLALAAAPALAQSTYIASGTLALGANARLYAAGSGLVVGPGGMLHEGDGLVPSTATATRTLSAPADVNVGGLGLTITSAAELGSTTVTRTYTVQTGNGNQSLARAYSVTAATNTGLNATLVFSYRDGELNGLNESMLALYRSTDGGTTWQEVGGTVNPTANTITVTGVNSFSMWTAGAAGALPVELVALTAHADGSTARLAWTTASETNNAGFYVEHQRPTGWAEVGFVPGRGTTTERTDYAHHVPSLDPGRHRFRLRQVDTDGTAHPGAEVVVEIGMAAATLLEVRGHSVRYALRDGGAARVALYSVLGQQVAVLHDGAVGAGTLHTVRLPDGLAGGVYFLRLASERGSATARVVVP